MMCRIRREIGKIYTRALKTWQVPCFELKEGLNGLEAFTVEG